MKRSLFLILWLALPLSHAQTLFIGTTMHYPPFSSIADKNDHFFGFDIDLIGEICKRLKASCKFSPMNNNDLFSAIKTGKINLAVSAIIITDHRRQDFLFSLPYLESNGQFIASRESNINSPHDIINKRVGVRRGTPFKELALNVYKNNVDILEFTEVSDLLEALTKNTIDVALMTVGAAKYWYANNSGLYKLIGTHLPVGEGYGIMANKSQDKLIEQINHALLDMEADGTYLEIYTRYF